MFANMINGSLLAKASTAVKTAEDARRTRVKDALFKVLGTNLPDKDVDMILMASRQADSVRGVAGVAGKNVVGEILSKIADALDGK